MLLAMKAYQRESASDPPKEIDLGIDPFSVAHIEPSREAGKSLLWCDGMDKPYLVQGTVTELVKKINEICVQVCSENE